MAVYPLGRVTSDLSVFKELPGRTTFTFLQSKQFQPELAVKLQFIYIIAYKFFGHSKIHNVIIGIHPERFDVGTKLKQMNQSAGRILLRSKDTIQAESLQHRTVHPVDSPCIDAFTFFCFNSATTRMEAPKFSPIATMTTSTLFKGSTDKACPSVASITKAVATLSFKLSTRPALMSAPITSCPKAESSSAST